MKERAAGMLCEIRIASFGEILAGQKLSRGDEFPAA
jgi:hypothetical protein